MRDPLMWTGSIEIGDILFELSTQLTFIQNEDVIQAFAADTAEEPFTNSVGFGGANRLKGRKTSSEGSFKRRRDNSHAGFRREHHDNESCHAWTVKMELAFADQNFDADGPSCSTEHIL